MSLTLDLLTEIKNILSAEARLSDIKKYYIGILPNLSEFPNIIIMPNTATERRATFGKKDIDRNVLIYINNQIYNEEKALEQNLNLVDIVIEILRENETINGLALLSGENITTTFTTQILTGKTDNIFVYSTEINFDVKQRVIDTINK